MRKEKVIVSLVIMMLILIFCSVSVFAANEATNNGVVTITANTSGSSTNNAATSTDNSANSANAASSNTNNAATTSTYIETNNAATATTNSATNTNNTSSALPYTGTSHALIFVIIAFVISAIYAYKKVSDYNV